MHWQTLHKKQTKQQQQQKKKKKNAKKTQNPPKTKNNVRLIPFYHFLSNLGVTLQQLNTS